MPDAPPAPHQAILQAFMALAGAGAWEGRARRLACLAGQGSLAGRVALRRHGIEGALLKLRHQQAPPGPSQAPLLALARQALALDGLLDPPARERFRAMLAEALTGEGTLIPLFHLLRSAARHRAQGYAVRFARLEGDPVFDLRIEAGETSLGLICQPLSAEEGRPINQADWFALVDMVNPDLQRWLAAHPGRYLLNMTLPSGVAEPARLPALHQRIMALLEGRERVLSSEDAFLKLDPLAIAGAQAQALPRKLREAFGPEAHLAVSAPPGDAAGSVCVIAARAGRTNTIAEAVVRRMGEAAARLEGRPGILAMFLDDLERDEWRALRETLELEGVARRFMTTPAAAPVVAASCASRMELLAMPPPDAAPDGEVRFRNQAHPLAGLPALRNAVLSSL